MTVGSTTPTRTDVDIVVVGGGILGLATAWKLTQRRPDASILVVEKEPVLAEHQTGRNSGVLHSGIYYAPGSTKARTCRQGQAEMIEFCREYGIATEMIGKIIVATESDELARLDVLSDRAAANGVATERLGPEGLRELEPHAVGLAALRVPGAGITDYRAVCAQLAQLLREHGSEVRTGTIVESLDVRPDAVGVVLRTGTVTSELRAGRVVTCTGLHGDRLARQVDPSRTERIMPFRGEYFHLAHEREYLVNGLIYPVPDPAFPFLGVHLTKMIDGSVHAGPNAVPALSREGYRWRDIDARDTAEILANPGVWRLGRKYWRTGAAEIVRSASKRRFTAALQRLVPAIRSTDLLSSPAGVRAQALGRDGSLLDDFVWHDHGRVVSVINAPSPAATASLALGSEIADRLLAAAP
jgi:(S)-2-hydroxyglutarate dehydrogenase